MRLCYYNPQSINIGFGETVLSFLASVFGTDKSRLRRHNLKYAYLLDLLRSSKIKSAIVVDGTGSSFSPILDHLPLIAHRYRIYSIVVRIEVYIWCLINNVNPFKKKIIFSAENLDSKKDVLFGFAYCTYNFFDRSFVEKSLFKAYQGPKVLHASHYYKSTKLVSDNIRLTGVTHMVAEANLKKNPYFTKHYDYIKKVYILPHTLRARYVKKTDFDTRKNKCLALGTLVLESRQDPSNSDYIKFFGTNTLHPMRKIIYEHAEKLSQIIDSTITLHNKKRREIALKSKWYTQNFIFRYIYDLLFIAEGKKYHSFNIVDKYNEYKMFIAPEENIGLSSINLVEGMACGCAYIGVKQDMYTDLGMIDKRHYIGYDGTLDDLSRKILYYQSHPVELEKIAQNGYELANKYFREKKVINDFLQYLYSFQQKKTMRS